MSEGYFHSLNTIPLLGPTKIESWKSDYVNGPLLSGFLFMGDCHVGWQLSTGKLLLLTTLQPLTYVTSNLVERHYLLPKTLAKR